MTYFITGVRGFSGARILNHMLTTGHDVCANVRHVDPFIEKMAFSEPRLTLEIGNLVDLKCLPEGITGVVHAAATSPTPGQSDEKIMLDNAQGTKNLVKLAVNAGVEKFIFLSSISVYGKIEDAWVNESTKITGTDTYATSKLIGEECLAKMSGHMPSVALRLPAVLGQGAARHWLATVMGKAFRGEDIRIYNPGGLFNNAVHIDDLCMFISDLIAMDLKETDIVTLGASGTMTIREIVDAIIDVTESRSSVIEDRTQQPSFLVSSRHAEQKYGYTPRDMRDILRRYLSENIE